MRIGILIRPFNKLSNWELRIIKGIIENPALDLSLLIQDARIGSISIKPVICKLKHLFSSFFDLPRLLLKLHILIERMIFPENSTVDKVTIINYLKKVDLLKVCPQKAGLYDVLIDEDVMKIRDYNLDLIIKQEFNIRDGSILEASRYGVWALSHSGNTIRNGGLAGFCEMCKGEPLVIVTLHQLTNRYEGGLVIDRAAFNIMPLSSFRTNSLVTEASVSLLFKNISKLENGSHPSVGTKGNFNPFSVNPGLFIVLKYIYRFYASFLKKIIEKIDYRLFGSRYYCWSIFIGEGSIMNSNLNDLKPMRMPKKQCWADPFLFSNNKGTFVFFENYSYKSKKGIISCGRLVNNNLEEVKDVLEKDCHLSYPFVFEDNVDVFLMPESRENKRLEVYKCINFPDSWELYSTAFEGEKVLDSFFFKDDHNQRWLFLNKQSSANAPVDCELYIFKVDSVKMNKLIPHKQNPVIIDSSRARNAGAIFKYNSEYYRPSQNNSSGLYGKSINICRINKLTLEDYDEEQINTIVPDFYKGLVATHHLCQADGNFVIDAAFKKL